MTGLSEGDIRLAASRASHFDRNDQVYAEQAKQLQSVEHLGFIATLINASILVLVQWRVTPQPILFAWFSLMILVTAGRYLLLRNYQKELLRRGQIDRWVRLFTAGAAGSGAVWGLAGIFLLPEASTLHQIFVPFVLGGMVAGAAVVYAAIRTVFFAYALPALMPLICHFSLLGDPVHWAMAAMLLLFLVLMSLNVVRLHRVVVNALTLRFENKNLVAHLAQRKELAELLNERLKLEIAERKNAEEKVKKHQQHLERTVREKTAELVQSNEQLSREIHERRQMEADLRAGEEKYRNLFEYSNDCIFLHDLQGKIIDVNNKVLEQFGVHKSDAHNLTIQDFLSPDAVDPMQKAIDTLVQKGFVNFENQFRKKSGEFFPAEVSSSLFTVGDRRVIQNIVRDVTERKHMEKELQKTKEHLENVIDNAVEAIGIVNLEGKFVLWNKRAEEIFGYLHEEVKNQHYSFMYADQQAMNQLLDTLRKESVVRQVEMLMRRKDGQAVPMELSMNLLRDGDGNKVGSLCLAKDLREKKLMEQKLLHAAKMEAVGTLAGGIAHDFNNLLQAVQGYAELLLLGREPSDNDYQELREIKHAAQRGAQLSRQLLTFSRKMESQLRPVALNRQIEETQNLLRRTIPKMISIDLQLQEELDLVNADPVQMEQILINFGLNAKDAMVEGGRINIATRNVNLDTEFCRKRPEVKPGAYVLLSVSDTGAGMDQDTLQHIFDPFFSTKEVGKGTGLGLSLVYGIVKNHGGYIECTSEPGRGTRFDVYLPSLPTSAEPAESRAVSSPPRGKETILVVDDEKPVRNMLMRMLTQFGYAVITAPDGERALDTYRAEMERIDLIILDVIMPGMGGRQCLKRLLEINPGAVIIMASGYTDTGPIRTLIEEGAKGFIGKPYQVKELLQAIRAVLDAGDDPGSLVATTATSSRLRQEN